MMLLIGTTLTTANSADKNVSSQISNEGYVVDECGGGSNSGSGIGIMKKSTPQDPNYIAPKQTIMGVPDYLNWKDFGGQDWTTTAKNQYYPNTCHCCYAFAPIASLESVINIREGCAVINPDLSEQYILSCIPDSALTPGSGCYGGDSYLALLYMMETTPEGNYHNGALFEECFPYQANDDISCDDKCPDWLDKLVPILDCQFCNPNGSPEDIQLIKSLIMENGPVVAYMFATSDFASWGYSHNDPNDCYPYYEVNDNNHAVIIVGWKDDSSISRGGYWICKNSIGLDWGYDGFFNIEYGSLHIDTSNCDYDKIMWVDYDPNSYEWANEPNPPSATMIIGEINGNISTEYEYTFNSVDPEGYDLRYYISWGDGNWEWTDYYPSGEDITIKHTWNKQGDYSVVALAMNTNDNIGSWGTLEISMPKNKAINTPFLNFLVNNPVPTGPPLSWLKGADQYQTENCGYGVIMTPILMTPIYHGAQEFKPTKEDLTAVALHLFDWDAPSNVDFTVCIRESLDGIDLTSKTIKADVKDYSEGGSWVLFDFDDITVTPEESYYLLFYANGGIENHGYCWCYDHDNKYNRGIAWIYNETTEKWYDLEDPQWIPGMIELDYTFITYFKEPKNKAINTPFLQFLENHPHLFPLLRQLLGLQ